ncbi:hypothetical protein [Leptolyngbya sp. KIOST-1]|uniref:hypothetical protein n=1 Tax=Leptolyngbya sp. KIOST-1 TaxID=1229172 RepID=UPI0012E024EE|nr:hypothetical protein [Leptolyngbya sp. KIOST-1]
MTSTGMPFRWLAGLLCAGLVACIPAIEPGEDGAVSPSPAPEPTQAGDTVSDEGPQATAPEVESFTVDELFAQGGGGCGMTLWERTGGPPEGGFVFFNGLPQPSGDGFTLMKLDGEFVRFRRTEATGPEFYGQQTSQTFVSQDDTLQLQVETTLGEPGEIESVAVEGTLQLEQNGDTLEIPVEGDAGC